MRPRSYLFASMCAFFLAPPTYAAGPPQVTLSGGHAVQQLSLPPLNLDAAARQKLVAKAVKRNTHQVTPKDFKPAEGEHVTPSVEVNAFPPDTDPPELRQYVYANLDREIAIINALTLTTVLVVPLPEPLWTGQDAIGQFEAQLAWAGGMRGFSEEQTAAAYRAAVSMQDDPGTSGAASGTSGAQNIPDGVTIRAGVQVPESIILTPFPPDMASELPQGQSLAFAVLNEGRVIVADADKRTVIGLIAQDEILAAAKKSPGSRDPLKHLEETGSGSAYTSPNEKR